MSKIRITPLLDYLRAGGARQLGYFIAIGTVAAVAARVSYTHIRDVTLIAGQPVDVAAVLPLAVDGMLLAASLAMSQDKAHGLQPRGWARFGFWLGANISVLCNIASTLVHATATIANARQVVGPGMLTDQQLLGLAVFVAVLAPLLLLITVEIMARPGKPKNGQTVVTAATPRRAAEDLRETSAALAYRAAAATRLYEPVVTLNGKNGNGSKPVAAVASPAE